jgi:flavin reductase (DIM6/NTAB) family NADH-FMN oxidoreductase RutF
VHPPQIDWDGVDDQSPWPPLLPEALAWFECQVLCKYPAGDHRLALGKVIGGKLLDAEAEPMSYRQTGEMDGASALFPDVLGEL